MYVIWQTKIAMLPCNEVFQIHDFIHACMYSLKQSRELMRWYINKFAMAVRKVSMRTTIIWHAMEIYHEYKTSHGPTMKFAMTRKLNSPWIQTSHCQATQFAMARKKIDF